MPVEERLPFEADLRPCSLADGAGFVEVCWGPNCPFWEEGGALISAGCVVERLGLQVTANPRVARGLLHVRRKLDRATNAEDEAEALSLFYRLVPAAHPE
jgi:hypothetical protein